MNRKCFTEQSLRAAHAEEGMRLRACLRVGRRWFGAIRQDVERLVARHPPSDVGAAAHPTNWTSPYGTAFQFSLYNESGDTADTGSDHNLSTARKRFAVPELRHLHRFFRCFEGRAINFRLNGLRPGSGLTPHQEIIEHADLGTRLRFHLPVISNPGATVLLNEHRYHLEEGTVYFFNNGCIHAADNQGTADRLHLVWDMFLDDWIWDRVLSDGSRRTPSWRMRKLSREQAGPLETSEPYTVDRYILYGLDGKIYQATRGVDPGGNVVWSQSPV